MKKSNKKVLAGLLAGGLIFSFAGCNMAKEEKSGEIAVDVIPFVSENEELSIIGFVDKKTRQKIWDERYGFFSQDKSEFYDALTGETINVEELSNFCDVYFKSYYNSLSTDDKEHFNNRGCVYYDELQKYSDSFKLDSKDGYSWQLSPEKKLERYDGNTNLEKLDK